MPGRVTEPIVFIDTLPVVALDAEGVGIILASGSCSWRRRTTRRIWRAFLEASIKQLNEFEVAERTDRGRVLAFKNQ